jgi:hypothetical protein
MGPSVCKIETGTRHGVVMSNECETLAGKFPRYSPKYLSPEYLWTYFPIIPIALVTGRRLRDALVD